MLEAVTILVWLSGAWVAYWTCQPRRCLTITLALVWPALLIGFALCTVWDSVNLKFDARTWWE